MVIALHASYVEVLDPTLPGYDFSYIIQRLILVIGEAAVPTFFVISGYLLFTKFTLKGYPKMLLGKVFSLVIPYFFWSVLALLVMQIALPLAQGKPIELTFKSVVIDILLASESPIYRTFLTQKCGKRTKEARRNAGGKKVMADRMS